MKIIDDSDILNKGLDWVRTFGEFEYHGNHYCPYPNSLKSLKEDYHIDVELVGSSDHGSAICRFTKKSTEEKLKETIEYKIKQFEEQNGIKILEWKYQI